jgi:hypothetical protein
VTDETNGKINEAPLRDEFEAAFGESLQSVLDIEGRRPTSS